MVDVTHVGGTQKPVGDQNQEAPHLCARSAAGCSGSDTTAATSRPLHPQSAVQTEQAEENVPPASERVTKLRHHCGLSIDHFELMRAWAAGGSNSLCDGPTIECTKCSTQLPLAALEHADCAASDDFVCNTCARPRKLQVPFKLLSLHDGAFPEDALAVRFNSHCVSAADLHQSSSSACSSVVCATCSAGCSWKPALLAQLTLQVARLCP